jgi:hypothetical protein
VSILPDVAILADHRALRAEEGFPSVSNTELALVVAPDASPATRRLADLLADFCDAAEPRPDMTTAQSARQRSAAKA